LNEQESPVALAAVYAAPSNNMLLVFRFILLVMPGDDTILVSDRIQTIAVGGG
jgi:hypothetical protein